MLICSYYIHDQLFSSIASILCPGSSSSTVDHDYFPFVEEDVIDDDLEEIQSSDSSSSANQINTNELNDLGIASEVGLPTSDNQQTSSTGPSASVSDRLSCRNKKSRVPNSAPSDAITK